MSNNLEQNLHELFQNSGPVQNLSLLLNLQSAILNNKKYLEQFGVLRKNDLKEEFISNLMDVLESSSNLIAELIVEDLKRKGFLKNEQLNRLFESLTKFLQDPMSDIFKTLNNELTTVEEKERILAELNRLKQELEKEVEEIKRIRYDTDIKSKELKELKEKKINLSKDLEEIEEDIKNLKETTKEQRETLKEKQTYYAQKQEDAEKYPEYLVEIEKDIETFESSLSRKTTFILGAIPETHELRAEIAKHLKDAEDILQLLKEQNNSIKNYK